MVNVFVSAELPSNGSLHHETVLVKGFAAYVDCAVWSWHGPHATLKARASQVYAVKNCQASPLLRPLLRLA
jgi:hypothetical protein